jgi:hypothetical protein
LIQGLKDFRGSTDKLRIKSKINIPLVGSSEPEFE